MASIAADLSSLAQQIATSQTTFEALQGSQYVTEEEQSEVFWGMRRWPNKLTEVGHCETFATGISACKRGCHTLYSHFGSTVYWQSRSLLGSMSQ